MHVEEGTQLSTKHPVSTATPTGPFSSKEDAIHLESAPCYWIYECGRDPTKFEAKSAEMIDKIPVESLALVKWYQRKLELNTRHVPQGMLRSLQDLPFVTLNVNL